MFKQVFETDRTSHNTLLKLILSHLWAFICPFQESI
nr:MAG TPA: hypothetical protein [Bacteriophage sp.]